MYIANLESTCLLKTFPNKIHSQPISQKRKALLRKCSLHLFFSTLHPALVLWAPSQKSTQHKLSADIGHLPPKSSRKIPSREGCGIGKPHAEVHGSKGDHLIELFSWRCLLDISEAVHWLSQGIMLCSLSCHINGQDHLSLDKTHNLIFFSFLFFWWWCLSQLPVPDDEWFCFRPIRLFEHCGGFKTSCKREALAIFHLERWATQE